MQNGSLPVISPLYNLFYCGKSDSVSLSFYVASSSNIVYIKIIIYLLEQIDPTLYTRSLYIKVYYFHTFTLIMLVNFPRRVSGLWMNQ